MGGEIRKKIVEWDTAPDEAFFKELYRVSRNQIIWGANYFPNMPPTRCFVVWSKASISENFSMAMCEYAWTSFSSNAKLFECRPQDSTGRRFHPTQKPVALYAWLLRMFANPGETIFDPMMGSQSSRIAAFNLGFDYTGCERDADYFAKGCARFDAECRGISVDSMGRKWEQASLFDSLAAGNPPPKTSYETSQIGCGNMENRGVKCEVEGEPENSEIANNDNGKSWSGRRDSNPRRSAWEADIN